MLGFTCTWKCTVAHLPGYLGNFVNVRKLLHVTDWDPRFYFFASDPNVFLFCFFCGGGGILACKNNYRRFNQLVYHMKYI